MDELISGTGIFALTVLGWIVLYDSVIKPYPTASALIAMAGIAILLYAGG